MKIHFFDSCDPVNLKPGQSLKANCGKQIANPYFAFVVDFDCGETRQFNSLTDCRNCNSTRIAKRYMYGVCEGQEMRVGEVA